ncbi:MULTISPECIES: NUDIX hydrolase [unclassified Gilliamella]|uniref:NUDIX hydrolase n=1 Tax=unclassified Gilliamella TaxID=2685620 RepID=UPI00226A981F|nr:MULTISPECIES: CoA pyrophosphatase [unclassified Gilliamella]MCX8579771.1 CoA pyrophosphatase [Gilliamella sp. B2717]MCX8587612.1 CoA pyrophosphatase [Gilliamella sp. B3801]MCX8591776.1 CoA pyrophosphatase [Gilliamella sp. B3804]
MITIEKITNQFKTNSNASSIDNKAAVLLPIINDGKQPQLLFQVRSNKLKWQPGDICFPGGRVELTDLDPEYTAKRETFEELGIPMSQMTILGKMPKFIATLGLVIYPFVAKIDSLDNLQLNRDEVEQIFTVPIDWFIENPPQQAVMLIGHKPSDNFPFHLLPNIRSDWQKRSEHNILYYSYNNRIIWGLTAQILSNFINTISR